MSPDLGPAHRRQHGPGRQRADGVRGEREHGEELGAAERKVGIPRNLGSLSTSAGFWGEQMLNEDLLTSTRGGPLHPDGALTH